MARGLLVILIVDLHIDGGQFSNFNSGVGAIDFHLLPFLSFYLITSNCEQSPLASLLGCDILWRGFYTMQSFMRFVGGNL